MKSTTNRNKLSLILSLILSVLMAGFSVYPMILGHYLFITFVLFFLSIATGKLFLLIRYAVAARTLGGEELRQTEALAAVPFGFIVLGTVIPLDFGLLFLMFLPTNFEKAEWAIFWVYLAYALVESALAIIKKVKNRSEFSPLREGLALSSINAAMYTFYAALILLLDLVWFEDKPMWMLVIMVAINATITILSVITPLSEIVSAKARTNLNPIERAKVFGEWLSRHQIFFFVQIAFQLQLSAISIILGITQHWGFFALSVIYLGMAITRLMAWIWRSVSRKKFADDEKGLKRSQSLMLLIGAVHIFLLGVPGVFAMIGLWNAGIATNIYWVFLIFEVSFVLFKIITASIGAAKAVRKNDPYTILMNAISILLVALTAFAVLATSIGFSDLTPPLWVVIITIAIVSILNALMIGYLFFVSIRDLIKYKAPENENPA